MDALVVRPHHKAARLHFDGMMLGTRVNHQGARALLLVSMKHMQIRNSPFLVSYPCKPY